MWTIGGKIFDLYDDLKGSLIKDKMEKVAHLTVSSSEEISDLDDSDFAIKVLTKTGSVVRKWPVDTSENTIISMWYFEKTARKLPDAYKKVAASNLRHAAQRHNLVLPSIVEKYANAEIVSNEIDEVKAEIEFTPDAKDLADSDYALITKRGEKRYPIDTVVNVERAAEYFEEYHHHLVPAYRCQMATNITKKASELEVDVSGYMAIAAYDASDYSPLIKQALVQRQELLVDDVRALFVLGQMMEKRASLEPIEFAQALESFDEINELDRYWDRGLTDPYKATFQQIKRASVISFNGEEFEASKLASLASDKDALKKHFDSNFIIEFEKDAVTVFNSLPTPEKRLIVSLVKDRDV